MSSRFLSNRVSNPLQNSLSLNRVQMPLEERPHDQLIDVILTEETEYSVSSEENG